MFSGKNVTILTIVLLIILALSFVFLEKKWSVSLALIFSAVIVFAILIWLNDKHYNEQMSSRVISVDSLDFVHDVVTRQMNMHSINKIVETDDGIEFYKGKHKAGEVKFRKDENGNLVKVDGKYIIEIYAPEYILHNIDHELWSLIGKK